MNSGDVFDEISLFNIGFFIPRIFNSYTLGSLSMSYSDDFDDYYKIAGFTVFRSLSHTYIARTTYDVLNFLGDIGGLSGLFT